MYPLTARINGARKWTRPLAPAGSAADSLSDLEFRVGLLRLGPWLGWAAIVALLAGVSLDSSTQRGVLLALTLSAATVNAIAMFVPWRQWLGILRGRLLVDLWSAGLIGFVSLLVVAGGVNFSLLLFLTVPYIAVIQVGLRRTLWLAVNGATCILVAAIVGLPAGVTAMRSSLVAAVVAVALVLARAIKREGAAHREAVRRAELERTLAAEANHRIKNNLQTVADLLLLDRPGGTDGRAFDDTAARIHSIATLHQLLAESEASTVEAPSLLASIARSAPVPVAVDADRLTFDSSTAQKVGLVANELITNAFRHGAEPISVSLGGRREIVLRVDDGGTGSGGSSGLGLQLVRQIAERGLGGHFELTARPGGGTRAEVVFPKESRSES
jgi:two-component sensor histidine kinase